MEIICHVVMLIQALRSCHWKVTAPQTITKFHKGGMAHIMDMETLLPTELCLGYDALGSEKADGHYSAIITLAEKYGCTQQFLENHFICINYDGTNTNLGDKDSVKLAFKHIFPR